MSTVVYEFGEFRLDPANHLLSRRDGTPVALTPRVFDTLLFMVEHQGTVLDKERLMEAVWPDSIVEENNLAQSISKLRQVFGEKPGAHRFIVTVPGRGYRFAAEVKTAEQAGKVAQASSLHEESQQAGSLRDHGPSAEKRILRQVSFTALAILLLGAGAFFWWRSPTHHSAAATPNIPSAEKSIAVLPFENLSRDPENAYFADGVQDEILTDLAKIADLKVISRMSVLPYKEKAVRNLPEIAQQLGVAHLLEGSVQRSGNRVRVNAQLIATSTGSHEWAETYDRELADVFAIQSEIAAAIAQQLQAKISPGEKAAMGAAPTTDLLANALYQQAKAMELTEPLGSQTLLEAVRLLDQAVARDPQFVLAYCLLGRVHTSLFYGLNRSPAQRELANVALQNASRLQPDSGEVHRSWAYYAYYGFFDYDRARAELDLARRTLPNDAEVYYLTALLDRRQSRWTEAARNFERAVELDPRNFQHLFTAGGFYYAQRRYSECRRLWGRGLRIEPRDLDARIFRASMPFDERADPRPLRAELSAILAEEPANAGKVAADLVRCALAERDSAAATRALDAIPAEGRKAYLNDYPRAWFAGLVARTFGDHDAARVSFSAARAEVEKLVLAQPDNARAWSLLGRIDAALGRREDALREGRRACELMPVSKNAAGVFFVTDLAVVYAWLGENDLALEQLAISARLPAGVYYGGLKLDPQWDPLRGDPRFEKIVASLAPKD